MSLPAVVVNQTAAFTNMQLQVGLKSRPKKQVTNDSSDVLNLNSDMEADRATPGESPVTIRITSPSIEEAIGAELYKSIVEEKNEVA